MKEVLIRFRAEPGSPHIEQLLPQCMSILSIGDHPGPLKIVGATLGYSPLKIYQMADGRVWTSPAVPLERYFDATLYCEAPDEPPSPPKAPPEPFGETKMMSPRPDLGYGLQSPESTASRGVR